MGVASRWGSHPDDHRCITHIQVCSRPAGFQPVESCAGWKPARLGDHPDGNSSFRGPGGFGAWLFGSYSRNEESDCSDIDILVDYDKSQPISLLKICGMMIDLVDRLGIKVDLVENGRVKDFAVDSVNKEKSYSMREQLRGRERLLHIKEAILEVQIEHFLTETI